jgi:hypothetical protein
MKKIFLYAFVFILAISLVFAAGNGTGGVTGSDDSGNLESGSENASGDGYEVVIQTMNQGEASQLKVQTSSEFGSTIRSGDGTAEAQTNMKMTQQQVGNQTKTYAQLSNGMNAEIKVMPDVASEKALQVLGAKCEESGCEIELKEVGKGEETKAAYEVKAKKEVKTLGFIKSQMKVRAQINAETGEIVRTRNAWWGFLAKKE